MPTYSYKCAACGNAFDVQQAMSDAALTECPSCGGPLRKVFSLTGVTFNGSGFYRTDSRGGSSGGGSKGSGGSTGSSAPSSGSGGASAS